MIAHGCRLVTFDSAIKARTVVRSNLSWFDKLTTNGINKLPFVLSKLFTRRLKGGIEKQGLRLAMVDV